MRLLTSLSLVCAMVLLLAGCNDARRIVWSKDGKRALVVAGDGLRACDGDGHLSAVLAKNVNRATWMGKSGKIAVVETHEARQWSEIRAAERIRTLKAITDSALTILSMARKHKGDWKGFEKELGDIPYGGAAALYLTEKHNDEMLVLLGEQWKEAQAKLSVGINRVAIYSFIESGSLVSRDVEPPSAIDQGATTASALSGIASTGEPSAVSGDSLSSRAVVFQTIHEIKDIHPNPRGNCVLLTVKPEPFADNSGYALYLVTSSGKAHRVDKGVAQFPDWTDGGKSILYIQRDELQPSTSQPEGGKEKLLSLATLRRRLVLDSSGNFIESAKTDSLARLGFNDQSKVCDTGNGIIFSAQRCRLPATEEQADEGPGLFILDPKRSSLVLPLFSHTTEKNLGDLFSVYFALSPDAKSIATADSKGAISICELSTGVIHHPDDEKYSSCDRLVFVPQWRNNDELCLQAKGKTTVEVVLYSIAKKEMRGISTMWPASARKEFID